ncbi:MAG: hypothetical protein PHF84_10300 [bacterium]|nr:hypothetical protein [bacterium]
MINFLLVIFVISMLYAATTSRMEANVKVLSIQGVLFFLMVLPNFSHIPFSDFLFLCTETLVVKTILIPLILMYIIRKNKAYREVEPYIPGFYSMVITAVLFVFGFIMAYYAGRVSHDVKPLYFGISMSVIMTGLFIIMSRKKIITHIMGYMFMENGIFLLSLSVAREMPLIVNLGILLDIFVGVFILVVFYNKLRSAFESEKMNIDKLDYLKD